MKTKNVGLLVFVVLVILAIVIASCANNKPTVQASDQVEAPADVVENPNTVVKSDASTITEEPVKTIPEKVNHFAEADEFFLDGDPHVEGFLVKGATMKYTCTTGDVYISMDPGEVNGHSTGDLGAAVFVDCEKGDVVTIYTPHFNPYTDPEHNSIHLVEFKQKLTADQALNFLMALKNDEGKSLALYISDGQAKEY